MPKFLIAFQGRPLVQGHKLGDFRWDGNRRLYVYLGREIADHEFNAHIKKVFKHHAAYLPLMQITLVEEPVAPIATITAHEITLEEAESAMQRLAPDRLKKQKAKPVKPTESAASAA